jgi:hypothetical protein
MPTVATVCNDCGDTDQFPTRSEAFLSMDLHEHEHGVLIGERVYVWQQFRTDVGWVNYRAPLWGLFVN